MKYGVKQLESALIAGLEGDFDKFTNMEDKMLRQKLMMYVPKEKYEVCTTALLADIERRKQETMDGTPSR